MENNKILQAKNIVKYFHDPVKFKALKDVSFDIKKSEFLTITGKSGCGKSTLMYILSTMDSDYEGELLIDGNTISGKTQDELAEIRNKNIGFVFQFHYLLPEFTCLKNIMIPALKLGVKPYDQIEHEAYAKLELLGIKEQALKPASRISGGQQQRVAIARALINEPKIIMGDEPTGNLDSKNTRIVLDTFKELSQEGGQTIIVVTHDNDFASKSDRTIIMADGQIEDYGY